MKLEDETPFVELPVKKKRAGKIPVNRVPLIEMVLTKPTEKKRIKKIQKDESKIPSVNSAAFSEQFEAMDKAIEHHRRLKEEMAEWWEQSHSNQS